MKRTALKRFTPLAAGKLSLRRTEIARKTPMKATTARMSQARSTDKATPEQAARWAVMRKLGCLCCRLNRMRGMLATGMVLEHHHLTSSGRRRGHDESIELCRFHHQGDKFPLVEHGYKANAKVYGPSYGKEKKEFRRVYGDDAVLLDYQNRLIAHFTSPREIK
jgi:hypothetical protein